MKLNEHEIVAALLLLGMVTLLVFGGCCLVAGGLQLLLGPISDHGETRDPAAWDRFLGIMVIVSGLGTGWLAVAMVRSWSKSTRNPDHQRDRRRS